MTQKFRQGDIVTLKSTSKNPGKTEIKAKSDTESRRIKTGEAINFVAPMVVCEVVTKGKDATINCFYYSSHMDSFVDKWFSAATLDLAYRKTDAGNITYRVGDVVNLRSVLIQSAEREFIYKFELRGLTSKTTYNLKKTYGSSYIFPPPLNIVRIKTKEDVTSALCMWHSRKTGRLFEFELPTPLLILSDKVKGITKVPIPPHP